MQYIKLQKKEAGGELTSFPMMKWKKVHSRFHMRIIKQLINIWKKNPPAILPIQIAYYAGPLSGETCGLTWQDGNLEEQYLTIKRRYPLRRHENTKKYYRTNRNGKKDC